MGRCRIALILTLSALTADAHAGPLNLFKKPMRPDPAEHVPALISTLKSDADERKRERAAADLREYDAKAFPDIVPALIEAIGNDASTAVRLEAVNTLGKMRPISQQAVYAMEQANTKDASFRVRASAKTILVQWQLFNGVRTGVQPEPQSNQTEEPPLADPQPQIAPKPSAPMTPPLNLPANITPDDPPASAAPPAPSKSMFSRPLFPLFPAKNSKDKPIEGPVLNPPK